MEEWSNSACFGYAIAAARSVGMTDQQIAELIRHMRTIMDLDLSVEEAIQVYINSPF